jgi:hypothetical protein
MTQVMKNALTKFANMPAINAVLVTQKVAMIFHRTNA